MNQGETDPISNRAFQKRAAPRPTWKFAKSKLGKIMAGKFASHCTTIFLYFLTASQCVTILFYSITLILSGGSETTALDQYPLHGRLPAVPAGWVELQPPIYGTPFSFRISLKPADEKLLESTLLRVSDPTSEWYGHHLGREEAQSLLQPSNKSTRAVLRWMKSKGIAYKFVEYDHSVHINTSLTKANTLLGADFRLYRSEESGETYLSTSSFSLPDDISQHVDLVHPSAGIYPLGTSDNAKTYMGLTSVQKNHDRSPFIALNHSSCNDVVDPSCLRHLYRINVPSGINQTTSGRLAVAAFLGAKLNAADLQDFATTHSPGGNFSFPSIISLAESNADEASNSAEVDLDVQLAVSLAQPVPVTVYTYPGRAPWFPDPEQPDHTRNEPYLEFLEALLALPNAELPTTLTISFAETEQSVPIPYARMVCKMLAQLGVRGVSVLVASGDSGVGKSCQANSNNIGKSRDWARGEGARFLPNFPASCPWVTAVGGTDRFEPSERAVPFSSGGFSDVFPRPLYQDSVVAEYLGATVGDRWDGLYNPQGRAIPDVAAQANKILLRHDGQDKRTGGTSAASPVFASVVSLLNAARLKDGLPPLGFLNPWLYQLSPSILNDVTEGSSSGCNGSVVFTGSHSPVISGAGWEAAKGWDAVTGLGTPDLSRMMEALYNTSMWFYQ